MPGGAISRSTCIITRLWDTMTDHSLADRRFFQGIEWTYAMVGFLIADICERLGEPKRVAKGWTCCGHLLPSGQTIVRVSLLRYALPYSGTFDKEPIDMPLGITIDDIESGKWGQLMCPDPSSVQAVDVVFEFSYLMPVLDPSKDVRANIAGLSPDERRITEATLDEASASLLKMISSGTTIDTFSFVDHQGAVDELRMNVGTTIHVPAGVRCPTLDARIWRYMSYPKLIDLATSKSLSMVPVSAFDDPWEAMYAQANFERAPDARRGEMFTGEKGAFVSCWNVSEIEEVQFWRNYSAGGGVAVQTRLGQLLPSMDAKCQVSTGMVEYVDYGSPETFIPMVHRSSPLFAKRLEYAAERELRLVAFDDRAAGSPRQVLKIPLGDSAIERVVVHPREPQWVVEAIGALIESAGLDASVEQSKLLKIPSL